MIRRDLSPAEVRVLGCLIEKARTTPEQYPLTRNAVRLACNQATNREPVVDFDEDTVRAALERLGRNGLVRFTSSRGSRAAKYRHLAGDALGVGEADLAVLALLMLRGAQTPGELRGRVERLHRFSGVSQVEETLSRLIEKGLAVGFERRPGQKEQRFAHLLSDQLDEDADRDPVERAAELSSSRLPDAPASGAPPPGPAPGGVGASPETASATGLEARVAALEAELSKLREQLADLIED